MIMNTAGLEQEYVRQALKDHFGFSEFREGQEEAIHHLLYKGDALVIMPTGSGKSLCYQLPALLFEGTSLIISPLIALMKDQVDALEALGLPATFINSTLSTKEMSERYRALERGPIKWFMWHLSDSEARPLPSF